MLFLLQNVKRYIFALCAVVVMLGHALAASPLAPDLPGGAVDRSERKRLAVAGKLPLPGTPDLGKLEERLTTHHVTSDASIMIRIFKAESELEVWMTDNTGEYVLFATYPVCFWSGTLGPKIREGDRQAPEGFYTVTLPQAHREGARWVVGLDLGFPNVFDRVNARSGSAILVHGGCASIGCFAVTNPVNDEINKLVLRSIEAGQAYVPIHVFPFRMTRENFDRYDIPQWRDFWRNLKDGYDLFERTHRPPRISVCSTSYVFDPVSQIEAVNPGPIGVCPTTEALLQKPDLNWRVVVQGSSKSPAFVHVGVSPETPVHCSPTLASCRKYAALRDKRAKKEAVAVEEDKIGGGHSNGHKGRRHTASRWDNSGPPREIE
jgi:murein L,D-transpeptidase YafK